MKTPRKRGKGLGAKAPGLKQRSEKVGLPPNKSRFNSRKVRLAATYRALDTGDVLTTIPAVRKHLLGHPEAAAYRRITEVLQELHLDPIVSGSVAGTQFVGLMRDLFADALPGMTLDQVLEPLRTVHNRHGGGRPPMLPEFKKWLNRFEAMTKRDRPTKTRQEIYEDIAAAVNQERDKKGGKRLRWTQIRKGIGVARKARKPPAK